nr:receptor-like protein EIX1 [Aegilops tauschii subsp. strangulata]
MSLLMLLGKIFLCLVTLIMQGYNNMKITQFWQKLRQGDTLKITLATGPSGIVLMLSSSTLRKLILEYSGLVGQATRVPIGKLKMVTTFIMPELVFSLVNRTGRVLALSLRDAPGGAELDDRGNYEGALAGRISPSLLSLSRLRHLDLSRKYLEGSPDAALPAFLGGLRSLRYLNLSGIYFSGEVPPQLGNLSRLRSLDLSSDFGTQLLRSSDLSWLARLPSLRHLSLSSIDMSRAMDWPRAVSMLPSLRTLHLSSCSLPSTNQWQLPAAGLCNLTNLEELDLSMNRLNHPAASSWFWNVTSLTHINLMETFLSGQLPDALDAMASLEILDFSYNGNMATMPRSLRNLCNLRYLDLESSLVGGQDMGKLMESLPQGCPSNMLQQLYLANNGVWLEPWQITRV